MRQVITVALSRDNHSLTQLMTKRQRVSEALADAHIELARKRKDDAKGPPLLKLTRKGWCACALLGPSRGWLERDLSKRIQKYEKQLRVCCRLSSGNLV